MKWSSSGRRFEGAYVVIGCPSQLWHPPPNQGWWRLSLGASQIVPRALEIHWAQPPVVRFVISHLATLNTHSLYTRLRPRYPYFSASDSHTRAPRGARPVFSVSL